MVLKLGGRPRELGTPYLVLFIFTLDLNECLAVIELLARKLRLERVDRVELILLDTSIGHVTLFELSFLGKKTLQ